MFLIICHCPLTAPGSISLQASAPPLEAASSRVGEAAAASQIQPSAPPPQDQPVAASPSPTASPVTTKLLSAHKENIPISNHVNNRWADVKEAVVFLFVNLIVMGMLVPEMSKSWELVSDRNLLGQQKIFQNRNLIEIAT